LIKVLPDGQRLQIDLVLHLCSSFLRGGTLGRRAGTSRRRARQHDGGEKLTKPATWAIGWAKGSVWPVPSVTDEGTGLHPRPIGLASRSTAGRQVGVWGVGGGGRIESSHLSLVCQARLGISWLHSRGRLRLHGGCSLWGCFGGLCLHLCACKSKRQVMSPRLSHRCARATRKAKEQPVSSFSLSGYQGGATAAQDDARAFVRLSAHGGGGKGPGKGSSTYLQTS
jgi:hypothetical protein